MFGIPLGRLLVAGAIAGIFAITSVIMGPTQETSVSDIVIESGKKTVIVGETLTTSIIVKAVEPLNVFKGLLLFDRQKLEVESIDYNTSIADLWAEEPWYSNGDGTLGFIGGTTMRGGFTGKDILITVTFRSKETGESRLKMTDIKLLRYDGLGTEATIGKPIDFLFTIESPRPEVETRAADNENDISIVDEIINTDLNNDGKQTIADISIFMADLTTQNKRSDFNGDDKVSLKDLSIMNQ